MYSIEQVTGVLHSNDLAVNNGKSTQLIFGKKRTKCLNSQESAELKVFGRHIALT